MESGAQRVRHRGSLWLLCRRLWPSLSSVGVRSTLGQPPATSASPPDAVGIPATVSKLSFSGLAAGKPQIGFKLSIPAQTPQIKSFVVQLPSGLRLSRRLKEVGKGVIVARAGRYAVAIDRGQLRITLKRPTGVFLIRLGAPALIEDAALTNRVAEVVNFNRRKSHLKKRVARLGFLVRVTDASRHVIPVQLSITVR